MFALGTCDGGNVGELEIWGRGGQGLGCVTASWGGSTVRLPKRGEVMGMGQSGVDVLGARTLPAMVLPLTDLLLLTSIITTSFKDWELLKPRVIQKPTLAVKAREKVCQNSPGLGPPGTNCEGYNHIGPKAPARM